MEFWTPDAQIHRGHNKIMAGENKVQHPQTWPGRSFSFSVRNNRGRRRHYTIAHPKGDEPFVTVVTKIVMEGDRGIERLKKLEPQQRSELVHLIEADLLRMNVQFEIDFPKHIFISRRFYFSYDTKPSELMETVQVAKNGLELTNNILARYINQLDN